MSLSLHDLQAIATTIGEKMEKRLKPIKKDLRKLKKDVSVLIDRTDREETKLWKELDHMKALLQIQRN